MDSFMGYAVTALISLLLGSCGAGVVLKFLLESSIKKYSDQRKQKTDESAAIKKLVLEMAAARLEQDHRYFIRRQYIEPHELRRLTKIYELGKTMGLNGTSKELYDDICELSKLKPKEN